MRRRQKDKSPRYVGHRRFKSYLIACFAAIVSCLCCSIPIILSALGFSDIVNLPVVHEYSWVFNVLAFGALFTGIYFLWYHHSHAYTPMGDDLELWLASLLMVILFGVFSVGTNRLLSNAKFNSATSGSHNH